MRTWAGTFLGIRGIRCISDLGVFLRGGLARRRDIPGIIPRYITSWRTLELLVLGLDRLKKALDIAVNNRSSAKETLKMARGRGDAYASE